jgi:hypothetical protein
VTNFLLKNSIWRKEKVNDRVHMCVCLLIYSPTWPKACAWTLERRHPSVSYVAKLRPRHISTQPALILRSLTYVAFTVDRLLSPSSHSRAPPSPQTPMDSANPLLAHAHAHAIYLSLLETRYRRPLWLKWKWRFWDIVIFHSSHSKIAFKVQN